MTVRTRFAPSPTGFLHIGGLRTALYSYLFAKKMGGTFILRIEDTDKTRFVEGSVDNLARSLAWAGIVPDEGVMIENGTVTEKGDYGPYTQSKRLDIYKKYVQILLEKGHAYHCFCTKERLDDMRKQQQKEKQPPMYDRQCCGLDNVEVQRRLDAGEKYVIRFRIPDDEDIVFTDHVRGEVCVKSSTIDDQVIMKADGFPTYHLASVVDDHLMNITHVIRGDEWLPSTPKHVLLYRAFGWDMPEIIHLPLLLNPDKSKLSKRQGDVTVEDYMLKGYLPEALVNFVALLGWHPGKGETQEIFSMEELIEKFELQNVHKAGAVCDLTRAKWFNAQYIKQMSPERLVNAVFPFLQEKGFNDALGQYCTHAHLVRVATVVKNRLETLDLFGEDQWEYFFDSPGRMNRDFLRWKENSDKETQDALTKATNILDEIVYEEWTRENLEEVLMNAAGEKRGDFLWPLRAALTGAQRSPSPFDCAWVIGKDETMERIKRSQKLFITIVKK